MRKSKFVVPDHFYDESHAFDFGIGLLPVFMFEDNGKDYYAVVNYEGYVLELYDSYDVICDEIDQWIAHMKKCYLYFGPDWFYHAKHDDEANSQNHRSSSMKFTASDLKQSSAGDEVSLDQHIQLYREVFQNV